MVGVAPAAAGGGLSGRSRVVYPSRALSTRRSVHPPHARVRRGVVVPHAAFFKFRSNGHSNTSTGEDTARATYTTRIRDTSGNTTVVRFTPPKRDIGLGDIGSDVENLQRAVGMKVLDGVYGVDTVEAVKAWQRANGVEPTGFFGPKSRAAMRKSGRGVVVDLGSVAAPTAAPSTSNQRQQPELPRPPAASTVYGTRKVVDAPTAPPAGATSGGGKTPGPVVNVAAAALIGGGVAWAAYESQRDPRGIVGVADRVSIKAHDVLARSGLDVEGVKPKVDAAGRSLRAATLGAWRRLSGWFHQDEDDVETDGLTGVGPFGAVIEADYTEVVDDEDEEEEEGAATRGRWPGAGDWRKAGVRTGSLADDASFETRPAVDFVRPTVLTAEERNARVSEMVRGYSERHARDARGAVPGPVMVDMKVSPPSAPAAPRAAAERVEPTPPAAAGGPSDGPRTIPASSPSAMEAYDRQIRAEAEAAAKAEADEKKKPRWWQGGQKKPSKPTGSKAKGDAAPVYDTPPVEGKVDDRGGLKKVAEAKGDAKKRKKKKGGGLFGFFNSARREEEEDEEALVAAAAAAPVAVIASAEETVTTYEAGRLMKMPRERTADGELVLTTDEKIGMGVSAAAVVTASAAAAISTEPAVVTISAAAVLAVFAERNLRYPKVRERITLPAPCPVSRPRR